MKKLLISLAIFILLLGGCGDKMSKNKTSNVEAVTTLDITPIFGKEFVLENSTPTIVFDKDKISGFAGVNRYFGPYTIQGNSIKIGDLGSTMMAGDSKSMKIESSFLRDLSTMTEIQVKGNMIILSSGDSILRFISK